MILDEAQYIKNPDSQTAKAAWALRTEHRLALSGTPIENRLLDLWSIMGFAMPGVLGKRAAFAKSFDQRGDPFARTRLAARVRPFVLRRTKGEVAKDLPERSEEDILCELEGEQATLYRAVVKDMMERIESAAGVSRRGLVLAALTKLKQVLNHPAHFLADASALPGRSGKLDRVTEMLEEALSEGDSALVFTQYREMGELLRSHFQQALLQPTLFFHGGLANAKRDELVERFQSGQERIMVLTLKAGGVGINLTRANHVFHFDRWWNPAVENQATDRAFRIGQKRNVLVHKFVCRGTVEERIGELIDSKREVSDAVLAGGEEINLTELSDAALLRLVSLDLTTAMQE